MRWKSVASSLLKRSFCIAFGNRSVSTGRFRAQKRSPESHVMVFNSTRKGQVNLLHNRGKCLQRDADSAHSHLASSQCRLLTEGLICRKIAHSHATSRRHEASLRRIAHEVLHRDNDYASHAAPSNGTRSREILSARIPLVMPTENSHSFA